MARPDPHPARQMSESVRMVVFLSLSGGLQDAYTYLARGGVFANAQTGNIVFMGQALFNGDWSRLLHYLAPVTAFALGVAAAELIRLTCREGRLHWRQTVLLAGQVQAFRKVHGYPFASTMCIGNLRSGMESLVAGLRLHDRGLLRKAVEGGEMSVADYYAEAGAIYQSLQSQIDAERLYYGKLAELYKDWL